MTNPNQLKQVSTSVVHAWRGVRYIFSHEKNFRIQVYIGSVVCIGMWWFPLSTIENALIIGLVIGVLILEIVNSVIEKFIDIVKPRLTYQVKVVKDMMAAAVLILSFGALCIGCIIFIPHIIELFF